jgi:hypothetical protein
MPNELVPPNERISSEIWEQTPEVVRVEIVALVQRLAQAEARLAKLEEQLRRNSGNSSQPPSQDTPSQKATRHTESAQKKRHIGGQRGHRGHHRELLPIEAVSEVVIHRPIACQGCGSLLLGQDATPYRHQVTEIPLIKATVTEHQVHTLTCLGCGATNRGGLPVEVGASQFGPNVVSLMALLMGCYRLSKRQVVEVLDTCFGVSIAASSVVNQQQVVSEALAGVVGSLETYIQEQPACNMDETSWRQPDQDKRCWLWVVVTTLVTVFRIVPSRSGAIARQLLGDEYAGVVGSDRCGAYHWLDPTHRQVCWSHLLRDFQKILERGDESYRIGANLKLQAEYLLVLWARVRDGTLAYADFLAEFPAIQCHIRYWLTQGSLCPCSSTAETCRNLLALDAALWRFATTPGVEPTNNAAERALRHPVIWRRTSHGTQSDHGSLFVQRVLTIAETCRLQRRSVFDFVRSSVIAYRSGLPAPSLLPATLHH